MIENKELGVVFAENQDEEAWYNVAQGIRYEIKVLKARNIKANNDLKLSAREIEQKFKKGAKASIKQNKMSLKVQKEFLKLAESMLS